MRRRCRSGPVAPLIPFLAVASTALTSAGRASAAEILPFSPDEPACFPDSPRAEPLRIWALPEAGSTPFVAAIEGAQESIRVMVYELGEGPILDALERRARSSLPIRVILDGARMEVNQPFRDRLIFAGAEVRWSSPSFVFTHAKTMILDGSVALISTANYGAESLETERNYVARDADPADVAVLVRLFDGDWRSKRPPLGCTRLVIAPVNARRRLLELIRGAAATLAIESMELSDDEVLAAVLERAASGVDVRVILAEPGWVATNQESAAFLAKHGIPVRFLRSPAVHVKSILVDGQRAYFGSENLTTNSLTNNREIGLITSETAVIGTIASTFASDWVKGYSF
jgi:phosphatidylserine/phosphatidylglycerophosphate/cardiolipin synthase-like enzyme